MFIALVPQITTVSLRKIKTKTNRYRRVQNRIPMFPH